MHDTEDPTRSSAADAAGMAADYGARATYARGYEDGKRAEKARADAAEQRVCELRKAASDMRPFTGGAPSWASDAFDAALASTADIAGRWVPMADFERSGGKALVAMAQRDAAIAARDEAVAKLEEARKEQRFSWEVGAAAERARDEVGIQLAAAQERIKLLEEGVELLRHIDEFKGEPKWGPNGINTYRVSCDVIDIGVGSYLTRIDAVPGDALGPVVHPTRADAPAALITVTIYPEVIEAVTRRDHGAADGDPWEHNPGARPMPHPGSDGRITAALEASGIDTSNVKGVE